MKNIQEFADAVQDVRASAQLGGTRLLRLHTEVYSDSFHFALALSCGPAKCQSCITTEAVKKPPWSSEQIEEFFF